MCTHLRKFVKHISDIGAKYKASPFGSLKKRYLDRTRMIITKGTTKGTTGNLVVYIEKL